MGKRNYLILNSKKGNAILDVITVIVFLFVFALLLVFSKDIFNDLNEDIQNDAGMGNQTKATIDSLHTRSGSFFDGLFVFFFALIWILMLVASFMIDAHPVFFIVAFILMIFCFFIAAEVGNAFEEVTSDSDISDVISDFPMTDWIMTNFLIVTIVIAFSIVLALYAKSRVGE